MVLAANLQRILAWWLIFLLGLAPLGWLTYLTILDDLGTDPVSTVVKFNGVWALHFIWLTLAVTPLKSWLKWRWIGRFRRMWGLYGLFYASLHLLAFAALLLEWRWGNVYDELVERPYITMGAGAYLLMLPLGVTSFKILMKKMGKNWRRLHRAVYVIAVLVLIHRYWQVRSDYGEVLVYAIILFILFGLRLWKPMLAWRLRC